MAHLPPNEILTRAREFQKCAEFAAQNDLFNACAVCSYAALFWAARAALAYEGFAQATWEHDELRTRFTHELIEARRRYPRRFGNWLISAYALRNAAQYQLDRPKTKKVRRMINHVKECLQMIEEVIDK